ncbi:serine/threonine-protein kinase [Actinocorallia libanotica]|uniref:non-specific serine/threonine protein kinase n=1 Tax=Actinocorallia libanotica TaxID=46162 RepID=A0ABN1QAA8_9ACTN
MSAEDGERRLAGRYLLLEALGSGGMGTVWRARDETLGREVAVKELRFDAEYDDARRAEACTRAVREAQASARLRHPGIITVHDAFVEDGRPWIIMQILDGASLDRVLERQGPLPVEQVARIGAEVLAALEAAHAEGILHRDIKPANIFLTSDGRAVLTDFGIATVEGQATITRSGMLVGSPGHIAPERLRGEKAGPQSDLWSLAGTLYRLVEGRAPFPGDSHVAVLAAVLTRDPVPPVRAGELGPLLVHTLARDPLARPEPSVVRRALERVAAGEATGEIRLPAAPPRAPAEAPTVPAPLRRPGRSRQPFLAGAVVTAAVLALVAAVVVATDERSPAVVAGGTPTSSAPVTSSAPAAPATPAAPENEARFTVPVDFCSLVPVERIREIIPNYPRAEGRPSGDSITAACSWDAPGSGVSVEVQTNTDGRDPWSGTSPSQARDLYLFWLRAREDGSDKIIWHYDNIGGEQMTSGPSSKAEKVADLGEEAFVYDIYGRLGAQMSKAYVRVSNLVFHVTYADVTNEKGKQKIRQNALQMARWVAEALDKS